MATQKEAKPKESIPSHDELLLEQFTNMGFVLVQWIGSKTVSKLAPTPSGTLRELGETNYGLVAPKQWLLVHKDDAKFKKFYRRPTAKEKPAKSEVRIVSFGRKGLKTQVTWPGMPVDTLDPYNR